ncbi:polyphosphate kinase [Staphylococcus saprophyticus]|jgi:polyphosphate kinase|uniref:Polyphosphate kinase n=1 Tax=Staphylococcus saprophyticus subsp. saprophyticus (strain ATCC 15305 / DSM 20229 / NCIMB 8711 / NCTC 7292 / S-41) TaxID=342451 RepID=PPK1_STAS1|nr:MULTISPECIES: RNA degradosome polyphosphate kinase [Staphylococcus]Q4A040.1 RecName: Full=Polyphosphate kinase; AltName: Full=ATP-polyphosphate phosphotransferase; AltName: Full=Polyphosphoric acid kinase [Staphylococcus saprophyticus subsp. saprophyticus ATCC 15305 = NCTC 7292]AMG19515.1 RNA degradosome polyphosphate kinase [Staphylococcus saprophyticus]AMG32629.1 RNA degradosome polyphosphate kinase [Staphylococcus saprophyticus]ASE58570.1 RNA degradosome polyphosphate kinase [Staphylococc
MHRNLGDKDLNLPQYYNNRELSWLDFNYRVLQEAQDKNNPLLEQLNFISIFSSNLDEFFMVRVAGLQDQVKMGYDKPENKAQLTPKQQLVQIKLKNKEIVDLQYKRYNELIDDLKQYQVEIIKPEQLPDDLLPQLESEFKYGILPTLTPLGIDAYHPFPKLNNKSLNIFVDIDTEDDINSAIVQIPSLISRFYSFNKGDKQYIILIEDIITYFINDLFSGYTVLNTFTFRITRNADLTIHEDGAEDLLIEIERFLKERKRGTAVRLEVDGRQATHEDIVWIINQLDVHDNDVYFVDGPLDLTMLTDLVDHLSNKLKYLKYNKYVPQIPQSLGNHNIFDLSLKRDIFFHHPYESFEPIVDFIREAAEDPNTIAIKQTLYRVSKDSPIINSLKNAAENGKQVTVLVELKARFDEENNVHWARMLEEAGCHVIYGMTHLKTHSKIALVVKRMNNKLTSFIHLGTGNYNDKTANIYTDMGLITTNAEIAEDAINFFNYLSGYSVKPEYNKLIVAPFDIRDVFLARIDNEIKSHRENGNGKIIMKMNSLTDKDIILKLFEASCAGVKVQLIIRGICCLKPGVPGISENIEVVSIVGRFLEHSRIYHFHNNGDDIIYLSSADAMTRNMIKRVEILFPVEDKNIAKRLLDYMNLQLSDNQKGRYQDELGQYHYIENNLSPLNSQAFLMKEAMDYGQQLKEDNTRPQVMSVNERKGWFTKIRKQFRK